MARQIDAGLRNRTRPGCPDTGSRHFCLERRLGKVACVATAVPILGYKIWLDYGAFRAVQQPSAEPGAPPASVSS